MQKDVCELPPAPGICTRTVGRFFYNPATQDCEKFIYGGCGGNANNFVRQEQCLAACAGVGDAGADEDADMCSLPIVVGPCLAAIPSWGYDAAMGKCVFFRYGGCKGNENRFTTQEECEMACEDDQAPAPAPAPAPKDDEAPPAEQFPPLQCLWNVNPGPCTKDIERYAYNRDTGACEPFVYGGCGGNPNNFLSLESCEAACTVPPPPPLPPKCSVPPPRPGICRFQFPRWRYSQRLERCVRVGRAECGDVQNNFFKQENCERACLPRDP